MDGGWLPFFEPAAQGRILSVHLAPPDPDIDLFDYHRYLREITGVPAHWPNRTDTISELRLVITYQPDRGLLSLLGPRRLTLDIVDYPGEWLLDLPLLALSFREWSDQALELARAPERRELAGDFLSFVDALKPDQPFATDIAPKGAELFRKYLLECRDDAHALSTLPPGRYLEPGSSGEKPLMHFFPLPPNASATTPATPGGPATLEGELARWYDTYKATYVEPFFRDHFSRIDRQIVLIDMLRALNVGPGAVADLERALVDILSAFRQGRQSLWSRIFAPRADRVLFAATKADHLHSDGYARLQAINAAPGAGCGGTCRGWWRKSGGPGAGLGSRKPARQPLNMAAGSCPASPGHQLTARP